jgi:hypothetical protein
MMARKGSRTEKKESGRLSGYQKPRAIARRTPMLASTKTLQKPHAHLLPIALARGADAPATRPMPTSDQAPKAHHACPGEALDRAGVLLKEIPAGKGGRPSEARDGHDPSCALPPCRARDSVIEKFNKINAKYLRIPGAAAPHGKVV